MSIISRSQVAMEAESNRSIQRFSDAKNIPEGAVILTEDEVERMKWDIIQKWKPKSEMWERQTILIYGRG